MKKLIDKLSDWKDKLFDWRHLGFAVAISSSVIGVFLFLFCDDGSVGRDLAPEFVSIGITIFFVDLIVNRRERKRELIKDMGGRSAAFAVRATRLLRDEGWLEDGSLEDEDFGWAQLPLADLSRAKLTGANFKKADLSKTNLACAVFVDANLTGAKLDGANLNRANFENAIVEPEQLEKALYLNGAIMRDGTKLKDPGGEILGTDLCIEEPYDGPTFEEWLEEQESE